MPAPGTEPLFEFEHHTRITGVIVVLQKTPGRDALADKQNLSALESSLQHPPLSWIGVAFR